MPSFFDLQKYAATGIASPDMTAFDKARALAAFGGGKTQTMTDVPPLSFRANGKPLISWSMIGNGSQTGTPTHDAPIMPTFCGKLVETDWTIPITNAEQTVPVYLGQTQTVRRIKKLVLTGEEYWLRASSYAGCFYMGDTIDAASKSMFCTHLPVVAVSDFAQGAATISNTNRVNLWFSQFDANTTVANFRTYLAQQYAAGTPVTLWYALATPEIGIVNEPLCKIGDYADELHSEDASVTIPTVKGENTLTVDTELQPSSMTITYKE